LALTEFIDLYSKRPIKDNSGGMKFNHCFAAWFIAKQLSPKFIIESGVWYGQSTWLFENACPSAKIFCLDLNFSRLIYKSKTATYIQQDFSTIDWSDIDPNQTLCFFDDHQNAYQRLKDVKWIGIKDVIFDDNYPAGQGDVYSLRKMLEGAGHTEIVLPRKYELNPIYGLLKFIITFMAKYFFKTNQHLLISPNSSDRENFLRQIQCYYDFPPVYLEKKKIIKNNISNKNDNPIPLINSLSSINRLEDVFDNDDYYHIAYVKLN
ncbi:MAG: hypothetical protein KGL95_15405, partial [Patescibacteria group bacterium]|nr:hypothetical protein [Patescibacteria group bacterium]